MNTVVFEIALNVFNVIALLMIGFVIVISTDWGFNATVNIMAWLVMMVTRPVSTMRYLWRIHHHLLGRGLNDD